MLYLFLGYNSLLLYTVCLDKRKQFVHVFIGDVSIVCDEVQIFGVSDGGVAVKRGV